MGFSFSGQQPQPILKDNCTVCMWSRLHSNSQIIANTETRLDDVENGLSNLPDFNEFAKTTDLPTSLEDLDNPVANPFVREDDLDGLATEEYVDEAIADSRLSVFKPLPAVETFADLPTPTDRTINYLCRIMEEQKVYALLDDSTEWSIYSDKTDFVMESELEEAIVNERLWVNENFLSKTAETIVDGTDWETILDDGRYRVSAANSFSTMTNTPPLPVPVGGFLVVIHPISDATITIRKYTYYSNGQGIWVRSFSPTQQAATTEWELLATDKWVKKNAMTKGLSGIFTQGVDFEGAGLPTFQEFLDANQNFKWLDGNAVRFQLNAPPENDTTVTFYEINSGRTPIGYTPVYITMNVPEGTGVWNIVIQRCASEIILGGNDWRGIGNIQAQTATSVEIAVNRTRLYNPTTRLTFARIPRVVIYGNVTVSRLLLNMGTELLVMATANLIITGEPGELAGNSSRLTIADTADLSFATNTFTGIIVDERPGRPLETFARTTDLNAMQQVTDPADPTSLLNTIIDLMPNEHTQKTISFASAQWTNFADIPADMRPSGRGAVLELRKALSYCMVLFKFTNNEVWTARVRDIQTAPRWSDEGFQEIATTGNVVTLNTSQTIGGDKSFKDFVYINDTGYLGIGDFGNAGSIRNLGGNVDIGAAQHIIMKTEDGYIDVDNNRISNVANPVNPQDAVNKRELDRVWSEAGHVSNRTTFTNADILAYPTIQHFFDAEINNRTFRNPVTVTISGDHNTAMEAHSMYALFIGNVRFANSYARLTLNCSNTRQLGTSVVEITDVPRIRINRAAGSYRLANNSLH